MSKSGVKPEKTKEYLERYMEGVKKRNPGEPEFVQAPGLMTKEESELIEAGGFNLIQP